jgi:hypothetical protein
MPKIKLVSDEVVRRGTKFNSILKPILRNPKSGGPHWSNKPRQGSQITIIGYDKVLTPDFNNWRFATFHNNFRAVYFETWLPTDLKKLDIWYLTKAYLNIYLLDRARQEEKEYICLHSDTESEGDSQSYYKASPHLHIKMAEEPIPKAHIALANYHLAQILSSEKLFFQAMSWGIELICDEILKRIP